MASLSFLLSFTLTLVWSLTTVSAIPALAKRPDAKDVVKYARWLVGQSSYGFLATLNRTRPFTDVISFADAGTGVPYFFLAPALDATGGNAVNDSRASFSLSEVLLGLCSEADPQSPSCGKITLSGDLKLLKDGTHEEKLGKEALFDKHPQFKGFPVDTKLFKVFKLSLNDVSLVPEPGLRRNVPVAVYLKG